MAIEIQVKRNEHIDKALRKLKRAMAEEGVLREVKDRSHFIKPSEKKRNKSAQARSRAAKEARMKKDGMM